MLCKLGINKEENRRNFTRRNFEENKTDDKLDEGKNAGIYFTMEDLNLYIR